MTVPRPSARQRLIDAAAALVAQRGVPELTLEAVAAAAGVTKGGLIYHFKTRDDLVQALAERMIGVIGQRQRERAARHGNSPGALLRGMLEETFGLPEDERQVLANLLAAAAYYPHLLDLPRRLFDEMYRGLVDGGEQRGLSLVLGAAMDGITLLELLDFHRFTPDEREAMREVLEDLIRRVA